jgi:hypothetical protein
MSTKKREPKTMQVDMVFACPFCGLDAGVASTSYAVIHALPYCDKFKDLPAENYLHAVNKKLSEGIDLLDKSKIDT